jgi:hypothetical protein
MASNFCPKARKNWCDNVFKGIPVGNEEGAVFSRFLDSHDFSSNSRRAFSIKKGIEAAAVGLHRVDHREIERVHPVTKVLRPVDRLLHMTTLSYDHQMGASNPDLTLIYERGSLLEP